MNPTTEARIRAAFTALADELVAALDVDPPSDAPERLLSIADAAEHLGGIARSTVYRELEAGRLRSVRVGGRRLIPASAIADYAAGAVPRGKAGR
ncbi:MAG TPA: helix-turn-helix domain-containing protein [Candidatus Limnocylindrales bacterium]|jgi:excisionase family DNA binding protein